MFQGTLLETDEKVWDLSFDVNVKSMFFTSKTCISMVREELLKQLYQLYEADFLQWKEKGCAGNIINMASVVSSVSLCVRCL